MIDFNGITFPASQVASSDPNTLDDYEEGTFTPDLRFGGGSVGMTYYTQYGTYTKLGRVVHISAHLFINNKGTSTGNAVIQGLPFVSANMYNTLAMRASSLSSGAQGYSCLITNSSSEIVLEYYNGGSTLTLLDNMIFNGARFVITGTYEV